MGAGMGSGSSHIRTSEDCWCGARGGEQWACTLEPGSAYFSHSGRSSLFFTPDHFPLCLSPCDRLQSVASAALAQGMGEG